MLNCARFFPASNHQQRHFMKRFAPVVSLFLLSVLLLNSAQVAQACGPSFVVPVFAFHTRPDAGLERYARGEIGIIQPTYHRSFLFVAYRYFNDAPFNAAEQKDLVSVWKAEIEMKDDREDETNQSIRDWIAARKKVLTGEPEPKIYTLRQGETDYYFFPNCTANAFQVATKTLENRIQQHGAANESVRDWIRAQDQVFTNCSEGKQVPAAAAAPEWLKNDREYQIAAAHFYATNFGEAKTRFERIAANRQSPWQPVSNYLVARTLIRQASTIEDEDEAGLKAKRRPLYEQAETQLQKVLSDASQREFHPAASQLINLVKYRLRPDERIHELAVSLSRPEPNPTLRQDLTDYRWLMDRYQSTAYANAEKAGLDRAKQEGRDYDYETKVGIEDFPSQLREDELTDWIFTFQSTEAGAFAHSFKKWQETKNPAWFVAAIAKAKKDSVELPALLGEAEKIGKTSPAFATVAFHQNRLLIETGKHTEVRAKLDSILNNKALALPQSARNHFSSQRMMVAENLDDFLQFTQRRANAFAHDGAPSSIETFDEESLKQWGSGTTIASWRDRSMFDEDAARVFNEQMPLSLLKQAVLSPKLPAYLKRNLLIAAWTRAVLLEDETTAIELAPHFTTAAPEFMPVFHQYQIAKTAAERRNAATYILVKFPALRPFVDTGYGRIDPVFEIESYRNNWWCAPTDTGFSRDNSSAGQKQPAEITAPAFLNESHLSEAKRERVELQKLGGSSTYLGRRAVEFAQKSPADTRVPESLHLAVRATRYGCQDCETGKFSKQAHDILKQRFPRSEWRGKTPYWFKDESCETSR